MLNFNGYTGTLIQQNFELCNHLTMYEHQTICLYGRINLIRFVTGDILIPAKVFHLGMFITVIALNHAVANPIKKIGSICIYILSWTIGGYLRLNVRKFCQVKKKTFCTLIFVEFLNRLVSQEDWSQVRLG